MEQRNNRRLIDQIRPTEIIPGFLKNPAGSALVKNGDTLVLCSAMVEEKIPPFLKGSGSGWVTAEYSLLPASTEPRHHREVNRGRIGGRTSEIQRLIGRSLRAAVDLKALGERTVWIDCDVIQADGGTRTASINGGFIALYLALAKLQQQGLITQIPVKDYIAAISVGKIGGHILLDLDYREDAAADVDMNIVMTGAGEYVEIQGTAEGKTYSREELAQLLALAEKGIRDVISIQKSIIGDLNHGEENSSGHQK